MATLQEDRTMAMKLFEKLFEWTLFALMFSALFVFKWAAILVIAVVFAALSLT
ncbi:MAG: hypothetical protein ABFS45_24735 [Pseudomonadota bacterium]